MDQIEKKSAAIAILVEIYWIDYIIRILLLL